MDVPEPWHIDTDASDAEELYIDVDDVTIILKRESTEYGFKLFVFPLEVSNRPIAELHVSRKKINLAYSG